jgi:predicted SprT family Zn-dependent metalloprotease
VKIPKSFKLMGQTIEVTSREKDFIENNDRVAFASYRANEIQLNPFMFPIKQESQKQHAFLHELVHFIIYYSGDTYKAKTDYMHQDEGFIDLTANLLHQAITTMEYES